MTTTTTSARNGRTETASSVSWMAEYQRDPTRYFRERFAAITAQNEREVSEAAKSAEERKYREAYNSRHHPEDAA